MLKMVEYGIFAVTLLCIFGLLISNHRGRAIPAPKSLQDEASPIITDPATQSGAAPLGSAKLL